MSKFVLQDKNTEMFIKSSAARCFEITEDLEEAALFKSLENAEKALKKMFKKNGEAKVSETRYVDKDFNHIFTFNSQNQKEQAILDGIENAENKDVVVPDLIIREIKFVLV